MLVFGGLVYVDIFYHYEYVRNLLSWFFKSTKLVQSQLEMMHEGIAKNV